MAYEKANFVGTWAVGAAGRQLLHNAANNRGQKCFNALAQFGETNTDVPLEWDDQIQSYTFTDVADVDTFLNYPGVAIRGSEFLEMLARVGDGTQGDVTAVISGPAKTVSFTVEGLFSTGDRIQIPITSGATPGLTTINYVVPTPQLANTVADTLAVYCESAPDVEAAVTGPASGVMTVTLTSLYNITLGTIVVTPASGVLTPELNSIAPNVYQAKGEWVAGESVNYIIDVTDSQGDTVHYQGGIVLPPGGPYSGAQVTSYVAMELDQLAFLTASASGDILTLEALVPGSVVVSSMSVTV